MPSAGSMLSIDAGLESPNKLLTPNLKDSGGNSVFAARGLSPTVRAIEDHESLGRYTADELQLSEKDEKEEMDSHSFNSKTDSNAEV